MANIELRLKDRLQVLLVLSTLMPLTLTLLLGLGRDSPAVVVVVAGIGILAAGFEFAWGVESLQFVVSQALALAVLATVQVIPEYSVEVVLASHGAFDPSQLHYVTASMTGANRLLLGLGWPLVVFLAYYATRRRKEHAAGFIQLEKGQSIQVLFLLLSTVYSFVIVVKGTLGPPDAVILITVFIVYLYLAKKVPALDEEKAEALVGPARYVATRRGFVRLAWVALFMGAGTVVVLSAADPFVSNVLLFGRSVNVSDFLLIQWLAPVLTEFPEAVTSLYWATIPGKGSLAIANLVSSKLNQWTLLMGTIPIAYDVALGGLATIPLTGVQTQEILLTASQSLYGVACLSDLRISVRDSVLLLALFAVQFFIPAIRPEVSAVYLGLSAIEFARTRKDSAFVSRSKQLMKDYLH